MRFHIGFSKRISLSFLLKILGVLAAAILGYFGFTQNAFALTYNGNMIQVNSSFDDNGNYISNSNIPVFSYDNFYFSDSTYYRTNTYLLGLTSADLLTSYVITSNINYYMEKPCNQSDNLSYTQRIRFYYRSGAKLNLSQVNVSLGNYGCNGYWEQNGDNWDYVMTCNLQPNNFVVGSLTFTNIPIQYNNISDYRVAIQRNFDYQCSINSGNVIENNNINTQNIINNQNQNTQEIINNQNENTQDIVDSIDNLNDTNEDINDFLQDDTPPTFDNSQITTISGLLPAGPVDSLLNIPLKFLTKIVNSLSNHSCSPFTFTFVFNQQFSFPCFSTLYSRVDNNSKIYLEYIPSGLLLIYYFKHLYKKVDRATAMKTNANDEWGVL